MAQITYDNPDARKKAVWYTGSSTIAEGMPLCHSCITTKNFHGYSDSAGAVGDTTAEGSLNEGKYIYVENPMVELSSTGTWTQATKLITDDGAEFDSLQVGMMVTVSSATDDDIDGVWEITAQSAADNTITLGNMTDAEAALVTDAIADVVVRINNVKEFAGVVAAGSPNMGQTGPGLIEVYVPNGAIVPVLTAGATATGKTILGVVSHTLTLGNPISSVVDFIVTSNADIAGTTDAMPVAVAMETLSAAGLCLARLDPKVFTTLGSTPGHEFETAAGTTSLSIDRMMIKFKNTGGNCQALHYRGILAGDGTTTGSGQKGVFRFETIVAANTPANKHIFGLESHLEIGGSTTEGGQMAPLRLTVRSKNVDPDMSGCGKLSAIHIEWHMRATTTGTLTNPPPISQIFYINADTTASLPTRFMYVENLTTIGSYVSPSGPAFAAGDVMIPCRIGSYNCWLVAVVDDGLD